MHCNRSYRDKVLLLLQNDAEEPVIIVSQFASNDPKRRDILYYTCSTCNISSKDRLSLQGHICFSKTLRKSRTFRYGLACSICGYNVPETNVVAFNEHMLNHDEDMSREGYECILCVFKGTEYKEYEEHLNSHSWKKPYTCESCPYKSNKEMKFKKHIIRHLECKGPSHFECIICGKICGTRNSMEKHKQMHKRNYAFKCDLCSITFRHKSALSQHTILSHTKERTFVCSVCNCLYDSQHSLDIHMKVHFKDNFFTCHVCGEKFKSKTTHRNHVITKHPNDRQFTCNICGECFLFKHNMLTHQRKHEAQTYNCPYCNKKFKNNDYLTLHCAIHEGKKPYKCTECNFETTTRLLLKKHLALHEPEDSSVEQLPKTVSSVVQLSKTVSAVVQLQDSSTTESQLPDNDPSLLNLTDADQLQLQFSCSLCEFITESLDEFDSHKTVHDNMAHGKCKEEMVEEDMVIMEEEQLHEDI